MRSILPSVLVPIGAVGLWRVEASFPETWLAILAGIASVVAIGFSMATGLRRTTAGQVGTPRRFGAVAALACVVILVGWWEWLWPCPITCAGGDAYAELLGMPIQAISASMLGLAAVIAFSQAHRTQIQGPAELIAWAAVGGTVYYLFLSLTLGLVCSHCLAVHTVVLCLIGPLLAGSGLRSGSRLATVVVAALSLHALYHPVGERSTAASLPAGELSIEDQRIISQMDLGRRYGDPQAPVRVVLMVNMHCSVCKTTFLPVVQGLKTPIANGQVHLVIRHDYQADGLTRQRLTVLAAAAAADGHYLEFLTEYLGSPSGPPETIDASLALRWQHLPAIADRFPTAIQAFLNTDREQLRKLGVTTGGGHLLVMPARSPRDLKEWSGHGDIDMNAVLQTIEQMAGPAL